MNANTMTVGSIARQTVAAHITAAARSDLEKAVRVYFQSPDASYKSSVSKAISAGVAGLSAAQVTFELRAIQQGEIAVVAHSLVQAGSRVSGCRCRKHRG